MSAQASPRASPQGARVVVARSWLRGLDGPALEAVADLLWYYRWGEYADVSVGGGPVSVWVPVWGPGVEAGAVYSVSVSACRGGCEAVLVAL